MFTESTRIAGSHGTRLGVRPEAPTKTGAVTTMAATNFWDFKTAVNRSFVPLEVSADRPDPFWGRIRSAASDQVHVYEVTAASHTVTRTPELIARAGQGAYQAYKVSLQLAGVGLLVQDNREAVLQPGDIALYDTQRPYSLCFEDEFRALVLMFPRHLIDLPVDMVGQLTATRFPGDHGVTRIIAPFLSQFAGNLGELAGTTGVRLTHTAIDLITTVLAHELDMDRAGGNPHLAMVQQIRRYIDANLASPDLTPPQIAAAHFISTRHLHSIFREQGTTVSSWIKARRLERCRRDLVDPLYADQPVAAIASRWGFPDACHFSRVFKATYGQTSSEVRAQVL